MDNIDDLVVEFLVESQENLDRLDRDLVSLEKNPTDADILASVFRAVHTIKGTSGFFGFSKLESVTHVGENLLSLLRDGQLLLSQDITTALLGMLDAVREMLTSIEASGVEGDGQYEGLVETLVRLARGEGARISEDLSGDVAERAEDIELLRDAVNGAGLAPAAPPPVEAGTGGPAERSPEPQFEEDTRTKLPAVETSRAGQLAESNIRVDVGLLDRLMDLVGELVLARNQVLQHTAKQQDPGLVQTAQRLNLITTELQEGVMKTRMQPIGNIWSKFPRVARDLAMQCGKRLRVEMEGEQTELDKTIIEAIKDPLTHIVRNSADHGIESPAVRELNGKPAEGRILLRAFHEGGQVNIEISDDGGGIDPAKIRERALQRGMISRDDAARMSEREVLNLIFAPGFSTAEKVTNVSGRGVGMDVVKTNIEKIGGTVDVQSRLGHGSVLKIKIPLTLAIIPALTVTAGGDRYAIPQVSLLELVRLEGEDATSRIETIQGAPVYRLRGSLLPLVRLSEQLNVVAVPGKGGEDVVNIVVLQADDQRFGLIVDSINDTEEIVVKPLGNQFKGLTLFAGATIMGDGRVALILDVLGIAQHADIISEVRDRSMSDKPASAADSGEPSQALLLCDIRGQGTVAIPLSSVARLEEFAQSSVETACGREVVQYRSQIMPLIRLSDALYPGSGSGDSPDPMQVVVYSDRGRSLGLIVDNILDIANENLKIGLRSGQRGILGSAVIQQRVADVVDVQGIIEGADPEFFDQPAA